MNNDYDKHLTAKAENNFLYEQINLSVNEIAELKAENKLLREQLEFLKRENYNLKILLYGKKNIIDFPDSM